MLNSCWVIFFLFSLSALNSFLFCILLKCRKEVVKLLEEVREHLYHANHTWLTSVRKHLRKTLVDGLLEASRASKSKSFISHPVPECSCLRHDSAEKPTQASSTPTTTSEVLAALGVVHRCPVWMDDESTLHSREKENEEDFDEDDSISSGLFFDQDNGNHAGGGAGELNNKEEAQLEDQEEEGGER